jgi:hypothetical protein
MDLWNSEIPRRYITRDIGIGFFVEGYNPIPG